MVLSSSSSPSLAFWLSRLASDDQSHSDEAKEALIAAGDEALPVLLEALDGDDDALKTRILSLLALLGSAQTAAPVAALLHDPSSRVRRHAASALARIPSSRSVPAIRRLLERDRNVGVRLSAVRSLIRLVQTGRDEALSVLLHVMSDRSEPPRVRRAALTVMPWVLASEPDEGQTPPRAMLARLARDPEPSVAGQARRMLEDPPPSRLEPWVVAKLLADLGSRRLSVWQRAVGLLGRGGTQIVEPLVDTMFQRAHDDTYLRRGALILKGLSSRQLVRLVPYFESLDEPAPLKTLIGVAGDTGSRPLLLAVSRLIASIAEGAGNGDPRALDDVRQLGHRALAKAGSRLAADDLCHLLARESSPGMPVIEAAALIGTRKELVPLLEAYRRCRGFKRLAIRDAVWQIVRREKIRRNDRLLARLDEPNQRAVREILGAASPGQRNGRRGARRIDNLADPLLS